MKCVKCGHEIMDGAQFCPYCGAKIAGIMPAGDKPVYTADVKSVLKSGRLEVYRDRVEFITGNAQKTLFEYSAFMAVKKGLDRINFITTEGQTVSCPVSRKNVHEAFVYIEQAFRPYIAERETLLQSNGIRFSFVSSQGLSGGVLDIMDDRAEFRSKSGQNETVCYKDVKSVSLSLAGMQFSLIDGTTRTYMIDKEIRDEVFSFVEKAVQPYIEERKEKLLAMGIYYSFTIGQGPTGGTVDIREDGIEFKFGSGHSEDIYFKDIQAVRLAKGAVELSLTNGTLRTIAADKDVRDEVVLFIDNAIEQYVKERTVGFGVSFGIDERIEVNEIGGVFHILRQGGRMITKAYSLSDIIKCECIEYAESGSILNGVLSGGMSLLSGVAGTDTQEKPNTEEKIDHVGVLLTIRTEQGEWTEGVRFGDFSLGMSRTNKKYDKYIAEVSKFMDYLRNSCPTCELIMPEIPENETIEPEISERELTVSALKEDSGRTAAGETAVAVVAEEETAGDSETDVQKDQFGITKYIEGVSRFIRACETPMMIAIQGSWDSSIMKMLSAGLEQNYQENLIWFNALRFTQSDFGEKLPALVGNRLISLLSGTDDGGNDRAVKAAKGIINIVSGFISQGSTDGQNLTEALFKDGSTGSVEKLAGTFSAMISGRTAGGSGKVIIFVDDLNRLAPAQAVELLESMKNFFSCRGCVFVVAADYDFILDGVKERLGRDFDESKGKNFLDKMFQVSFRVPVSGYNILNYVREKLAEMEIRVDDETEPETYVRLIRHSVGSEPDSMKRLFNSYLLLRTMADEEVFESMSRRLMLFALLCMQMKFREIYDLFVRMKDKVTPTFLSGLCDERSEVLNQTGLSDSEKTEFFEFARVFYNIIDIDNERGISEAECSTFTRVFAEVLEFSSITSM